MAENKTQPTSASVADFIAAVPDERKRADAEQILALMRELSGEEPVMWGPSIIGFGRYHYHYESGRQGDAPRIGFSPRKTNLVLYIVATFPELEALLARLGRHKVSVSCLYVNKLADLDLTVLREIITKCLAVMDERYPR